MTSELSFELLATHQLERGRIPGSSRVELRDAGNLAFEIRRARIVPRCRLWDTRTGELVQNFPADTFSTEEEQANSFDVAVSGDGSNVAIARWVAGNDVGAWSLSVMDTRTGEVLVSKALDDFLGASHVRFSGDGRYLVYSNPETEGDYRYNAAGVIEVETGVTVLGLDRWILGDDKLGYEFGTLSPDVGRVAFSDSYNQCAWLWSVPPPDSYLPHHHMRIPRATFGISDAAFNSDGSLVLTSGGDGSARIWNVETGTELLKLDHGRHVLRGRFSPDGSRILTACAGGVVRLWDARNGDLIAVLADGGGFELQIAFSPDGLRCATGRDDGAVRFLNSVTGEPLGEPISHPDPVSQIAFTLDGKRLVSASASEVLLSDAESGVTLARIDGKLLELSVEHDLIVVGGGTFMQMRDMRDGNVVWALNRGMTHAAISPDGARLLCWDEADGDIHDFDVVSGAPVGLFGRPQQGLGSSRLSFNRDGSRVLIFCRNSYTDTSEFEVWLCDSTDARVIKIFEKATAVAFSPDGLHFENATALAFSPDGLHLWNGHELFNATNGRRVRTAQFENSGVYPLTFVTGVEFSPDGSRVILLGEKVASIHDADTGNRVSRLTGHTAPEVQLVEFDPSGNHLLTIDAGVRDLSMLRVWEAETGRELSVLPALQHDVADGGCFSPDLAWALTWSNGETRVYDPATGANVAVLTGDKAEFSPGGARVLTSTSGQIRVWDTKTWSELAVVAGGDPKFSPDATSLLMSSGGKTHVWDATTWVQLAVLPGYNPTFSPDGTRLLMSSGDKTHVWDTKTWSELTVLSGRSTKFGPDGARVLTRTRDQTRVWDARTWRHLAVLPGDDPTFSPDGSRLLARNGGETRPWVLLTGPDGQTHVYDPVAGSDVAVLPGYNPTFSPDDTRLLTSGSDQIYVWETKTWSELAVLPGKDPRFSPDGTRLLTAVGNMNPGGAKCDQTHVWDTGTWRQLAELKGSWPSFLTDGTRVLTTDDGQTRVWDAGTWNELAVLWGQLTVLPGEGAKFSPDATSLLTFSESGIGVWDTVTWTELAFITSSEFFMSRPAEFTADGTRLLTWTRDGYTRVWDTRTWSELAELPYPSEALTRSDAHTHVYDSATGTNVAVLTGDKAACSPDGMRVLTHINEQIHVWDAETGSELAVLSGGDANFSPDGALLLTSGGDQTHVWDTETWTQLFVLTGRISKLWRDGSWRYESFSPDGKRVFTNKGDQVHVWDTETWTERGSFPSPLCASNDGRYIFSTPSWRSSFILDLEKGGALIPLVGRNDRPTKVTQANYSPDGSLILTTGDDGRIRLWDPVSGSVTAKLDAGTTAILAGAEFSPDGKTVLAACGDYSLRLWDVASGRQLATIEGHDFKIDAFSFSADGQQIVTVSGSTLRRWGRAGSAASDKSGAAA